MANLGLTASSNRQLLSAVGHFGGRKPPRPSTASNTVEVVDSVVYTGPPQPTVADLMKSIRDLANKASQLSKNQRAIETKLQSMTKELDAIDANKVAGAVWLRSWADCAVRNMSTDGSSLFLPDGIREPHWK
jgi:hypothetical protein